MLLVDTTPLSITLEEANGGKKLIARGEFARSDTPTANKRLYRRSLWEREVSKLQKRIEERRVFGEADHPADGKTSINRISHVLTNLYIDEDGILIGEAEILPTERGKNLEAILKSGCKLGVSSRGTGTLKSLKTGIDEVQEDYSLNTFDFVVDPANVTSYPDIVSEGKTSGEDLIFEGLDFESSTETMVTNKGFGQALKASIVNAAEKAAERAVERVAGASVIEEAQVELYKKKVSELEKELQAIRTQVDEKTAKITVLESANTSLVEQIKEISLESELAKIDESRREAVKDLLGDTSTLSLTEAIDKLHRIDGNLYKMTSNVLDREKALRSRVSELEGLIEEMQVSVAEIQTQRETDRSISRIPDPRARKMARKMKYVAGSELDGEDIADISESLVRPRPPKDRDDYEATKSRIRKKLSSNSLRMEDINPPRRKIRNLSEDLTGTGQDAEEILRLAYPSIDE